MRVIWVLFSLLYFISCTDRNKEEEKNNDLQLLEAKKERFYQHVREENEKFDYEMAMDLGDTLQTLVEKYRGDTIVVDLYFELARLYVNHLGDVKKGISIYLKIKDEFPDHEMAPESVFAAAFIFENRLGKKKEAEKYYKLVMREYPDHRLAKDAEQALKYMYLSDEELIRAITRGHQDSIKKETTDTALVSD